MSYEIELRGGPHDGERVEVLNPPPIGQPVLALGATRSPYRVRVWERDVSYGVGPGFGLGDYVPSPGHRPWTFDPARGEWVPGDVVPSGSRLRPGEAGLAVIVGSSMGIVAAVLALAVYVVGWLFDFLAERAGGWLNAFGWAAIAGAVVCVVWALIDPDMVRQELPSSPVDEVEE